MERQQSARNRIRPAFPCLKVALVEACLKLDFPRTSPHRRWLYAWWASRTNVWDCLRLPQRIGSWPLSRLQQAIVTTGRRFGDTCALLLAFPGGRPSESAATWSDAGPDRTAADTGGVADAGIIRIDIAVLLRCELGQRGNQEVLSKLAPERGAICTVWCGSQTVRGAWNEKSFHIG